MLRTIRAARFLIVGPLILVLLVVINAMTSPEHWWVQWAALGIGIAWVVCLFRVVKALVLVGGIAALGAYLMGRQPTATPGQRDDKLP
jgi:hypothetical protein